MNNCIKKLNKYLLVTIVLGIFCCNFNYVYAGLLNPDIVSEIGDQETTLADTAGFDVSASIGDVVAYVIQGFLALLGVIFVILIILGGYKWMNAGGNEEQVREAQEMIRRAIIGLIIIIGAYSITYFVFSYLPFGAGGGGLGTSP